MTPVRSYHTKMHDNQHHEHCSNIMKWENKAVMKAWAADQEIEDTIIKFYGDPWGNFTKACGMELTHADITAKGLIGRCKRFAMFVVDSEIRYFTVAGKPDTDPAGDEFPENVLAENIVRAIKETR